MTSWVRITEDGMSSLDTVKVFLEEKSMWLTVLAAKGGNPRFPGNISIGNIKAEISTVTDFYADKKLHLYDAAIPCVEGAEVPTCGGYEYLDDYVVKPSTKLYCSLESQNVAGDSSYTEEQTEWDGLTWVQFYDRNQHWEQVLLPDQLPEGKFVTATMLKRTALAKIGTMATNQMLGSMRVFRNRGGVPAGAPIKGSEEIYPHLWYTVVVGWDSRVLVMTAGEDLPSPDSNSDEAGWEVTADTP